MTTPNTDLEEQITRELVHLYEDGKAWEQLSAYAQSVYKADARAILPIVVAAVKRGQAEAWEKAIYHAEAAGLTASERRACMADNPYEEGDTR